MKKADWRKLAIIASVVVVLFVAITGGAVADRLFGLAPLDLLVPRERTPGIGTTKREVMLEESIVIDVAERVSPSVVTVAVETPERRILEFSPFGGLQQRIEGGQQNIGTGFVVSEDGLIVTNKHVVASDDVSYVVITGDGEEFEVQEINRDPSNDIAILRIETNTLTPVVLGNSDDLRVGQYAIAIGTALGEFKHTVTTGVVSGLGRGITAGSRYQGYVEELENVIQTDAAINPGNSGGPLLDSAGQVIGINVAVATTAENIGFAIPVNVLKEALNEFRSAGGFPARAYLGVRYQMIGQQGAVLNEVPQGAYVVEVVEGSPASDSDIEVDDIITHFGGEQITQNGTTLAEAISQNRPGDQIELEIWRDGDEVRTTVTLGEVN